MTKERYRHLNTYLKEKFGERTLKICVDGGFTCPNRDGSKSRSGCIFCSEQGAGDLIKYRKQKIIESIKSQVCGFLDSYRGERANKFIVYFQSFTNTYDTLEKLKLKYDAALECSNKIIGLEVATRPDCITEDIARLLSAYKNNYYVCVELGLQTADDGVGELINRKYSTEDFVKAVNLLHKYGIPVVGHVMIGLPNDHEENVYRTIDLINRTKCEGVKFHSVYVLQNTELSRLYNEGKYSPVTMAEYVRIIGNVIAKLDSEIIVHRINADPPKDILIAPDWTMRKKIVLNAINSYLEKNDIYQGSNCKVNKE